MADNCGLEIVFSLMNEKDNGYWPKFNTLPNTKISHISSDIEDDLDEIIPGSALWNPEKLALDSNFTAALKILISKIYRDCKNAEINQEILNSIYLKSESIFYKLLDKLALMQKLLMEEEGLDFRRNQAYLPSLNAQNSLSVVIAASTLPVADSVTTSLESRVIT